MRSVADDMQMTYPLSDDIKMKYPPADNMHVMPGVVLHEIRQLRQEDAILSSSA